ncbi:MAG: hypothetical protein ABSG19_06710 [Candidatus Aminicenantales bacterium]
MTKIFKPTFTITNRITARLTRIERARGFLEAATLSEAWVREMGRRVLILEAHHTTHIEGTRLTLEQAERLLEGDPVPEADIEKLGRINRKYKEEGSTVIDLLRGFKEIYQAADLEGKAAILGAVVDRATLRGDDLHVSWKQPFDILFTLGEGVLRNTKWRA